MDIDEQKACDVLDFLAKKLEKNNMVLLSSQKIRFSFENGQLATMYQIDDSRCWCYNLIAKNGSMTKRLENLKFKTKADALETLLMLAGDGYSILEEHALFECMLVIPAYSTLESILVEMDIEEHED